MSKYTPHFLPKEEYKTLKLVTGSELDISCNLCCFNTPTVCLKASDCDRDEYGDLIIEPKSDLYKYLYWKEDEGN